MELLFVAFLFGVFSAVVASSKGRSGFGWFLLGFLFGPLGLVVALLPSKKSAAAPLDAPAATLRAQPLEAIELLARLRDSGAISPDEYDAKKTELLKRI